MPRLKPAKCGRWPTMPAAKAASEWQAASCSARPVAYPTNAGRQAKVGSAQPYQWLTHWNVLATTMSRRLGGWSPVGEVGEDRVGGGLKRLRGIGRMPEHVPRSPAGEWRERSHDCARYLAVPCLVLIEKLVAEWSEVLAVSQSPSAALASGAYLSRMQH